MPGPTHVPPIPPRYWWLKRLSIASIVIITAIFALRALAVHLAQRRLDEQIAEYRRAGQMVYAAEFDAAMDAVPEERNAALLYEKAMGVMVSVSSFGLDLSSFNDNPELFKTNAAAADDLMAANQETLALIHEASLRPDVAWINRLANLSWRPSGYSAHRQLARLFWFVAAYHFERGNHHAGVNTMRDAMTYLDAMDREPSVIAYLVSIACMGLMQDIIKEYGS